MWCIFVARFYRMVLVAWCHGVRFVANMALWQRRWCAATPYLHPSHTVPYVYYRLAFYLFLPHGQLSFMAAAGQTLALLPSGIKSLYDMACAGMRHKHWVPFSCSSVPWHAFILWLGPSSYTYSLCLCNFFLSHYGGSSLNITYALLSVSYG